MRLAISTSGILRPARQWLIAFTALSLITAHLSFAFASPAATSGSPPLPCHSEAAQQLAPTAEAREAADVAQGEEEAQGTKDRPCPMMQGALCTGLFAVFVPPFLAYARTEIAALEPWFDGPAAHPHLLTPPQRPPKTL